MPTFVRCSSLTNYPDCPRRWAAATMRNEIVAAGFTLRDEPRGIGASIGISIHRGAEVTLQEKASSGSLPPLSVATDVAMTTLREEMKQGTEFDKRFTRSPDEAAAQVVRMASSYHVRVAARIEPIIVEKRLEARIPTCKNELILTGQPDVVARHPDAVRDQKGTARPGNYLNQIGGYALLARTADMDIKTAFIDWVPRTSLKHPQQHPVAREMPIEIAEQGAANVLRHIDESLTVWRRGDEARRLLPGDPAAFLANPQSMLCNPKYCAAHSCTRHAWCNDWQKDKIVE